MTLLTNLGNYAAVTILGVLLLHYLNGRFDRIDKHFEKFDLKLDEKASKADVGRIDAKLDEKASKADVDRLAGEIATMRSDLTQVALAIGARQRPR